MTHVARCLGGDRPTRPRRTLSLLASHRLFDALSGSVRQNGSRLLSRFTDVHLPSWLSLCPQASRFREVALVRRVVAPWHLGLQHTLVRLAQLALPRQDLVLLPGGAPSNKRLKLAG